MARAVSEAAPVGFAPVRAETGEPCNLAMQRLWLSGSILPVGGRLVVRHDFRSAETRPIEVVYAFCLPRDAALRRFRVVGKGFSVRSELRPVKEAQRAYEEGIDLGHLSTLARQYGDGVVNLSIGNIRPGDDVTVYLELLAGVEARDDGFRFRFPFTLAPRYHASAKAIEIAPGVGEIELPAEEFDDLIQPQWVADPRALHRVGFALSVEVPGDKADIASPSHPIRVVRGAGPTARVLLATEGDVPDRDLVLDVRSDADGPVTICGTDETGHGRFAAIIPSTAFGKAAADARKVVLVLDRSGSMEGLPMRQALRAAQACLGALAAADQFGIVAFDTEVMSTGPGLMSGDANGRERAARFLDGVSARGGTELLLGLKAAFELLGAEGGDVFLLTDGQVAGTEALIGQAKRAGVRIHCLGIGSASQDRFLAAMAEKTGGVSRMVTPRERVDMAAVDLFASAGRPVATSVRVEVSGIKGGRIAVTPASHVFAGTPVVVFGAADGEGEGALEVFWRAADTDLRLSVPLAIGADRRGEPLRLLEGAKRLSGLEVEMGGEDRASQARRQASRVARAMVALSREYGLASREMALVAVVERAGDQPGDVPQTRIVPVGMPQDTEFTRYFAQGAPSASVVACGLQSSHVLPYPMPWHSEGKRLYRLMRGRGSGAPAPAAPPGHDIETAEDVLLELAGRLEPDGGLPGRDEPTRVTASLLAALVYVGAGHTPQSGSFAPHVRRLLAFLEAADLTPFAERERRFVAEALERLKQGDAVEGDWLILAQQYLRKGTISLKRFWAEAFRTS